MAADTAAEQAATAWAADPAGAELLGTDAALQYSSPGLADATTRTVREWQAGVLELVRNQGQSRKSTARYLAFGVNGLALMVMVVVFAHTAGLTGGEVAVAGGATVLSQKILEAVLGDQAVRALADQARADLHRRVSELLETERRRFTDRLAPAGVHEGAGAALRAAVQDVEEVR